MNTFKSIVGISVGVNIVVLSISAACGQTSAPVAAKAESRLPVAAKSDSIAEFPKAEFPKLEGRYAGLWVTTWNKQLDGTTNCIVKQLAADRWQGRFWGIWQQVPFDYTVEFERAKPKQNEAEPSPIGRGQGESAGNLQHRSTGNDALRKSRANENGDSPADGAEQARVNGKAMIDGASYDWAGVLTANEFNIKFTGSRYQGHLELTSVKVKPPTSKVAGKEQTARKE